MRTALVLALLLGCAAQLRAQPIFDYVKAPDRAYKWSVKSTEAGPGDTQLVKMELVSQVWHGITWTHALWVLLPKDLSKANLCVLVITGGKPDSTYLALGSAVVKQTGCIMAVLGDIPNQPLFDHLSEDALIAYTFVRFLDTHDATWPALFPMTKSAVRAMDAIQDYCQKEKHHKVPGFVTTGASKRGWTTWFTGVVDKRVVGIAPIVYDNLNLPAQMAQQRKVYSGYSAEISDYTKYNLPEKLATAEGAKLSSIVDPYTYRDRLTMPKLMLVGSNDPYWTLEAANLYYGDLPGEKSILYFPNGGHDLGGMPAALVRLVPALSAFTEHCAGRLAWPKVTWQWKKAPGGGERLTVHSNVAPTKVSVWTATSAIHDFRPAHWALTPAVERHGVASYTVQAPASGYSAAFAELSFKIGGREFMLCTTPKIAASRAR
jgi:PhoPQ-activated pathogenicity-related protein